MEINWLAWGQEEAVFLRQLSNSYLKKFRSCIPTENFTVCSFDHRYTRSCLSVIFENKRHVIRYGNPTIKKEVLYFMCESNAYKSHPRKLTWYQLYGQSLPGHSNIIHWLVRNLSAFGTSSKNESTRIYKQWRWNLGG